MFSAERNCRWLYNTISEISHGRQLGSDDVDRLSVRFVGCNAVIFLVSPLYRILRPKPSTDSFLNGVAYSDLNAWLTGSPDDHELHRLLEPRAVSQLQAQFRTQSWKQIWTWIAIDAFHQIVSGESSPLAMKHAFRAFRIGLVGSSRSAMADTVARVGRQRSDSAQQAFERFWLANTDSLTRLLRTVILTKEPYQSQVALAADVQRLEHEAQVGLTRVSAIQVDQYFRQLIPQPPHGRVWLREVSGKLLAAKDFGVSCQFKAAEKSKLLSFLDWFESQGFTFRGDTVRCSVVWKQTRGPEPRIRIPDTHVLEFLEDWDTIFQEILPRNLHRLIPAIDLFTTYAEPRLAYARNWIKFATYDSV